VREEGEGQLREVNGTKLYCEVRGSGPGVIFISPATGDCGLYARVATTLSDKFTCVSFDRRGNSRSPKPDGWRSTTLAEQAADVAGVIQATIGGPAFVFGSSGGATVAIEVLIRHPEWVSGMIIHEPALPRVLTPEQWVAAPQRDERIDRAMRESGPRAAMEVRLRIVIGDAVWEALDVSQRERMLGNAETLFFVETEPWGRYLPDENALRMVKQNVLVLVSADSPQLNLTIRDWLLERIPGSTGGLLPGRHVPYLECPDETAAAVRGHLKLLAGEPSSGGSTI
jgi:pimeloyl-ACP methyl ester carboxylesterase